MLITKTFYQCRAPHAIQSRAVINALQKNGRRRLPLPAMPSRVTFQIEHGSEGDKEEEEEEEEEDPTFCILIKLFGIFTHA
jgi:hypothetical protein